MQTLLKTYTGSELIIHTLKQLGVDKIFGYPGAIVLDLYDKLSVQRDIKHYLVRHEQAAIHAAEGYAQASNKCGIVLVTSGPGATNIVTGLANAYADGTPIIAITGQVSAELLGTNAYQEIDITSITKACTKKNFQVTNIKNLQSTLQEAYAIAMSDRKGPVLIDITQNVFKENIETKAEAQTEQKSLINHFENIEKALVLIKNSQKPVIIAGKGASFEDIKNISHKLNIPVVKTMMGFYPQDDNYIGMIGIYGNENANRVVEESDLIFAVGTRLNNRVKSCLKLNITPIIHLNINEKDIVKDASSIVSLVGDSKTILNKMTSQIFFHKDTQWLNYAKNLEADCIEKKRRSNIIHSFDITNKLQKYIDKYEPIVTTEVGQHQIWAAKYLKFKYPNQFIISGGLGSMGFGFPAAIGACISENRPCVCIAGDGSFQMNMQELATCKSYNLPIKILIFNNGYLGMVRQMQEKSCDERYYATKINNPNFVELAKSYGIEGLRVEKKDDIDIALNKAFSTDKPIVVDFMIEPMEIL